MRRVQKAGVFLFFTFFTSAQAEIPEPKLIDEFPKHTRVFTTVKYYTATVSRMPAVQVELRVYFENPKLPEDTRIELVSSEMRDVVQEDLTVKRQQFWAQSRIDDMLSVGNNHPLLFTRAELKNFAAKGKALKSGAHNGLWYYTLQGAHKSDTPSAFTTRDIAFYFRVYLPDGSAKEIRGSDTPFGYYITEFSNPYLENETKYRDQAEWKLGNIHTVQVEKDKVISLDNRPQVPAPILTDKDRRAWMIPKP